MACVIAGKDEKRILIRAPAPNRDTLTLTIHEKKTKEIDGRFGDAILIKIW